MNVSELIDIAPKKYANLVISDDMLSAQSVLSMLNRKLDLDAHNEVSGTVSFLSTVDFTGNDMKILDGNYIQTSKVNYSNGVYNFSGKNSFLQAEEASSSSGVSYGIACTGARGYPILSVDAIGKRLKLSGDLDPIKNRTTLQKTLTWSMTLSNTADTACAKVLNVMTSDVSSGIIQLDTIPAKFNPLSAFPEESCIWCYHNDDNAFYCPFDPTIGTVNIANFYANHSEGGSTRAIGKYSHAEGRQTIADIRYSHAEGSHCFAGGMAAHCEGFGTPTSLNTANGQASHCEGMQNKAFGIASHAAGYKSCANDDVSYVWSGISSATTSSHGEGTYTVDPKNGVNGFYIGNMSLGQLVDGCMDVIKVYSATSADVVNSTGTLSANSIKSAVQKAGSAHVLQLQNDVSVDFSQSINQQISITSDFTVDLNGHTLSVINTDDAIAYNAARDKFFINVSGNDTDLVIQNGKIVATKSCLIKVTGGGVRIIDAQITTDNLLVMMTASAYNARLEFIADEKTVIMSKYSSEWTRCPAASDNYMIWVSRTNNIANDPSYKTGTYTSLSAYRAAHPEYFPHLVFKGEITVEGPACVPGEHASTVVYQNGAANMMGMIVDVEDGAKLNCPDGVALYSGNNNLITLNGGMITGATGIGFRGGTLVVPAKSNVTVLGTGYADAPVQYVNAGWATCCSNGSALLILAQTGGYGSNQPFSTTQNTQEVDIESGRFISLKNEPIASIAMWKNTTYTEGNVYPRLEKFVNGGYLSQFPDSQEYDEMTGKHASYNIVADGCYEQTPCQIMRVV